MVSQEDEDACELDQTEEVGLVNSQRGNQTTKIMQPGEQALDFPSPTVAPQLAAVLRSGATAVALVGFDRCRTAVWRRVSSGSLS